ncbi:hypothetical protein WI665_14450 [Vibrio cholerae]
MRNGRADPSIAFAPLFTRRHQCLLVSAAIPNTSSRCQSSSHCGGGVTAAGSASSHRRRTFAPTRCKQETVENGKGTTNCASPVIATASFDDEQATSSVVCKLCLRRVHIPGKRISVNAAKSSAAGLMLPPVMSSLNGQR